MLMQFIATLRMAFLKEEPRHPQQSNAECVHNMSRFNVGKLPGNSKHFMKKSKDKAVPGKRSFKR